MSVYVGSEGVENIVVVSEDTISVTRLITLMEGGEPIGQVRHQKVFTVGDDVSGSDASVQALVAKIWTPAMIEAAHAAKAKAAADVEAARIEAFKEAIDFLQLQRDEAHANGANMATKALDVEIRNLIAAGDRGEPLPESLRLVMEVQRRKPPAPPAPAPAPEAQPAAPAPVEEDAPEPEIVDDPAADRLEQFAGAMAELQGRRDTTFASGELSETARLDQAMAQLARLRDAGEPFPPPAPEPQGDAQGGEEGYGY